MDELTLDTDCARGDRGTRIRVIQEWLTLHGFAVAVDGSFGPATEEGVRRFQSRNGLRADGVTDKRTYAALVAPMVAALAPIDPGRRSLGSLVVAYAKQHLRSGPREVGGQNAGPWVRLYMNGHEGPDWPWCAGFACFVLQQACDALQTRPPIRASFSCDSLAASAKERGVFLAESRRGKDADPAVGAFFLNRRTPTDWVHTGIVIGVGGEAFDTIEGNTNDEGSREGYEVCRRVRGYGNKDFILV
jgi:hypothetical protein